MAAPAPRNTVLSPASTASRTSNLRDRNMSDLSNYRRDLAVLDSSSSRSQRGQASNNGPGDLSQVAPWMAESTGGPGRPGNFIGPSTTFYDDSSDSMSFASQLSPAFPPASAKPPQTATSFDSTDPPYSNEERRPSVASIATSASSQGSKTSHPGRGGFKKLQGFFGEDFPGQDRSDLSLPSVAGKEHRSQSYSTSRPHRDRNYSNATVDRNRDASPSSSRPRTPVPAPEVVPFLYQDSDVSLGT
jgi:adenylate cyclase